MTATEHKVQIGDYATARHLGATARQVVEVSEDGARFRLRIYGHDTHWLDAADYTFMTEDEQAERIANEILAERGEIARHVLWHNGDARGMQPGSFTEKLLDAWARADYRNDLALSAAFPILGQAVKISRTQGSDALAEWAGIK